MENSLGVFSWEYDRARQTGVTRIYQRVSAQYAWICTYFGADVGQGVKANQAYDGPSSTTTFLGRFQVSLLPNSNATLCMLNRQRELTLPRSTAAPTAASFTYF